MHAVTSRLACEELVGADHPRHLMNKCQYAINRIDRAKNMRHAKAAPTAQTAICTAKSISCNGLSDQVLILQGASRTFEQLASHYSCQ